MEKVNELFMNDNDLKALELLYEQTNDELVEILINWKNDYEELDSVYTNEYAMYDDLLGYVWNKYEIGKEV